jgi:hypothetical protein
MKTAWVRTLPACRVFSMSPFAEIQHAGSMRTQAVSRGGMKMSDVTYVSNVRIERKAGPLRLAYLPAESEPVSFGVHGQVARHYGVTPDVSEPHATTLDYVVAAAGG